MFFQLGSYVVSVRVVNQVKLTIMSQFQPHFGEKDGETCKMTKFGHFVGSIQATFLAKFAIVGDFEPHWCETIWKSWKTQNICWCTPPPNQKWTFLGFPQKWDSLVAKDGKSCELGEIDNSESISASFWGKMIENRVKWPNLAILNQSNPLFWPNLQLWVIFEPHWSETIWNSWKTQKICQCTHPPHYPNYTYLYTLDHNFVTIHPIWKKQRCKCALHQGTSFHYFGLLKISKKNLPPINIHGGQNFFRYPSETHFTKVEY